MTPEELEELRALVGRLNCTAYDENLAAILGAALEHIDQQAKRIETFDDVDVCLNCGKTIYEVEVRPVLGEIHFDPGDCGSRFQPPEPSSTYFMCSDCLDQSNEKRTTRIEDLEAQVVALQEIAVYLYAELAFMKDRCEDRLVDECGDVWADYADIARRQLAKEHPEAFR